MVAIFFQLEFQTSLFWIVWAWAMSQIQSRVAMFGGMEELIMRMQMGQRQEKRRVRVLEVRVPLMWTATTDPPPTMIFVDHFHPETIWVFHIYVLRQ